MIDIIIEQDIAKNRIQIFACEMTFDGRCIIGYDGEKIVRTYLKGDEMMVESAKPLLSMPYDLGGMIIELLAKKYNSANSKSEKGNDFVVGKLEATEKHLSDMRDIAMRLIDHNIKGLTAKE